MAWIYRKAWSSNIQWSPFGMKIKSVDDSAARLSLVFQMSSCWATMYVVGETTWP